MACRPDGHVIPVTPERHLIARLDPQLIPELLRNDHLPLGADTMSHTNKSNYGSNTPAAEVILTTTRPKVSHPGPS